MTAEELATICSNAVLPMLDELAKGLGEGEFVGVIAIHVHRSPDGKTNSACRSFGVPPGMVTGILKDTARITEEHSPRELKRVPS